MWRWLLLITICIGLLTPAGASLTAQESETDPYASFTIDHLRTRDYGGGAVEIVELIEEKQDFYRLLIRYPSDGLTIYGFMNLPKIAPFGGRFPVVIAIHGYVDPGVYSTLDYTTRYADALARAGFLVLHPNLRGYYPSSRAPEGDLFRVGFAVDVLNLIALVRETGGQPGALEHADPDSIGLWGHSMGGGISLRVLTVSPEVRAAVLYGSMSADEYRNAERILYWSGGESGLTESQTPPDVMQSIAPIFYLNDITAAVSIHHGDVDDTTPLDWALDLCTSLIALEKPVECFTYAGQGHIFREASDTLFIERSITFYDAHLRNE